MGDPRSQDDIQSELDLLASWSELGAPQMEAVRLNLHSLMDSADIESGAEARRASAPESEAPSDGAPSPAGALVVSPRRSRRPRRRPFSLALLGLALLAGAGAVLLLSRWEGWKPRPLPSPGGPTEVPESAGVPSEGTGGVVALSPSPEAASPEPTPSLSASPAATPTAAPSGLSASAEPSVRPTPEAAGERVYRVQPGDSLYRIAREQLGNGDRWPEIYDLNRGHVLSPAVIRAGQVLRLPAEEGARSLPAATAATHRTVPGDSLSGIARARLGSAARWPEIYALNRAQLSDPDHVPVGLVLRLPTGHTGAGPQATFTIVVRPGDTLSLLARRYLGDAGRWPELYALNRAEVSDPARLYPGQRLRLPGGGGGTSATGRRYVVKAGDTLWAIAKAHTGRAEDWTVLWEANRQVADPRHLSVGQVLTLPF